MLKRVAIVAGLLSIGSWSTAAAQTCDRSPLVIARTNIWTPAGLRVNQDVLIRDGRVATIADGGTASHSGVRRLDGAGHTLLPGLVDSHLHFTIPGGLPAGAASRGRVDDITGRQLLRSGVTSGRLHLASLDDAVRLKTRSADPCQPIPRLQVGGPGLSGAIVKDVSAFQGAASADDGRTKVERFGEAGVDWLAIHDADRFAPGVLEAIAAAARRVGLRIMAAGNTGAEIMAALAIRPDTLDYFDRTPGTRYDAGVLAAIRAQVDLTLVPTPGVPYRTGVYLEHAEQVERPENFEFLSEVERAFVVSNARKDLGGPDASRARDLLPSVAGKLEQLRRLGVPMAMGSDAGSTLHFQGAAAWWELEAWRSSGASHRDALTAATEHGARVLRMNEVGRLTVGSRADFVLYRGHIEDGPFEQSRVLAVGKDGVLFVADGRWIGPPMP